MQAANISAYIDKTHPKQDLTCSVSIRVTHQRKRKYYPTGISVQASDFDRAMTGKRRTEGDTRLFKRINSFLSKAIEAAEALPVFTFTQFEEIYLNNREASDTVSFAFQKYIQELRDEKRIGTAISYECAKGSIDSFKKGLRFADITPALLRKYENWMYENGKTSTTVGIYLRSLRTIFNRANIDKALYPFGEKNGKYSIPVSRNIKKALNPQEIGKIYHYKAPSGSTEEMAKDYWIFLYLSNGMNVKDFCLLKRKNIDGDFITFIREKTKRSRKEKKTIYVSLKPEIKAIILKWGQASINPETYIFPHLQKGMTPEQEKQTVHQLNKTINKYMKRIAKALEINKPVTTYFARHSFATNLKNSNTPVPLISEMLGHSSIQTTENYLSGFEQEAIHKATDALLNFGS
jgi:integrase/recombinase XerD